MKIRLVIVLCFLPLFICAQKKEADAEKLQSTLYYYSYIDGYVEFYKFNDKQFLQSFTTNGSIYLRKNSYLNLEFVLSNAWDDGAYNFTVGDMSVTYSYNKYSDKFLKTGFQGVTSSFKMILPTGKSEYLSGLDNWIIEPSVYYGWLLKDNRFFFTNKIRINTSVGSIGDAIVPDAYFRFEPRLGFENEDFWVDTTSDLRTSIESLKTTVFMSLSCGYKVNSKTGWMFSFKKNINDKRFYNTYLSIGFYTLL
ncbi:MAG: hypothetical protein MI866_14985 [Bacteroidales bacterium]|nr:hypothetical protein [Bacteroidales bacterium]